MPFMFVSVCTLLMLQREAVILHLVCLHRPVYASSQSLCFSRAVLETFVIRPCCEVLVVEL